MIGTFLAPPFPINPIGIATCTYSVKKQLIVDLSAPHASSTPSINLIPSTDFSLNYLSVEDSVAFITSAFKVMPQHPNSGHLFGARWREPFYFAVRLTFGCKSNPKIFDTLSEALCWMLINNYNTPFLVHLLDDFLSINSPSPPASGLTIMTSVFQFLGVSLTPKKCAGPATELELLRLIQINSKPRCHQVQISSPGCPVL